MTATPPSVADCLARLARRADEDAWEALVAGFGTDLARTCAAVAGADLGQDALHETLLRLRDRAGRFAPPADGDAERAARGWARRVAATTALELLRARRRQRERAAHAPTPRGSDDPADLAARRERDALVRRELAALPSDQREAVTLHYLLGAPLAEVAAAQGIGVEAAKKRAQRGAERLRARLARVGVALSLPLLAELRADEIPFDHARALDALASPAAPAFGALKGVAMVSAIALPLIVAGVLAAQSGGGGEVHAGDHPPPALVDAAEAALRRKLDERIDLVQQDVPADQVLATLAKVTGIPIDLDGALPRRGERVTTDLRDRPVRQALDRVAAAVGARWRVRGGRILVDADPAGAAAAAYPPVTFDFSDTRLRDAADTLAALSHRTIGVTDGVAGVSVTLKGRDMRLDAALTWMAQLTGTAWSVAADGAIVIGPAKAEP